MKLYYILSFLLILTLSVLNFHIHSEVFAQETDGKNDIYPAAGISTGLSTSGENPSLFEQLHSENEGKYEIIKLDKEFYSAFIKKQAVKRDNFLRAMFNRTLQGRGYIESAGSYQRYHRNYRIKIIDSESLSLNIKIYVFTDNEEYLKILKKGDLFEFKGQFIISTPLSSSRDSYIFDIVLEDGALVVE